MMKYSASFGGVNDIYRKTNGETLNNPVLLLISAEGNPKCGKEYLAAALEKWNTHSKFWVLIGDDIQCYNLGATLASSKEDLQKLILEARKIGDRFITANLTYLLAPIQMTVESFKEKYPDAEAADFVSLINQEAADKKLEFRVFRWADWLKLSPTFDLPKHLHIFENDVDLKTSVAEEAQKFFERSCGNKKAIKNCPETEKKQKLAESTALLTVEWLVIIGIALEQKIHHLFYPGAKSDLFTLLRKKFLDKVFCNNKFTRDLAEWGQIRFKDYQMSQETVSRQGVCSNEFKEVGTSGEAKLQAKLLELYPISASGSDSDSLASCTNSPTLPHRWSSQPLPITTPRKTSLASSTNNSPNNGSPPCDNSNLKPFGSPLSEGMHSYQQVLSMIGPSTTGKNTGKFSKSPPTIQSNSALMSSTSSPMSSTSSPILSSSSTLPLNSQSTGSQTSFFEETSRKSSSALTTHVDTTSHVNVIQVLLSAEVVLSDTALLNLMRYDKIQKIASQQKPTSTETQFAP